MTHAQCLFSATSHRSVTAEPTTRTAYDPAILRSAAIDLSSTPKTTPGPEIDTVLGSCGSEGVITTPSHAEGWAGPPVNSEPSLRAIAPNAGRAPRMSATDTAQGPEPKAKLKVP